MSLTTIPASRRAEWSNPGGRLVPEDQVRGRRPGRSRPIVGAGCRPFADSLSTLVVSVRSSRPTQLITSSTPGLRVLTGVTSYRLGHGEVEVQPRGTQTVPTALFRSGPGGARILPRP